METTIVKQVTVRDIEAPSLARAVEIANERVKKGDVDWGNVEIGHQFVDVVEVEERQSLHGKDSK